MNKIIKIMIALALCLSMAMALASCEMLPDELRETLDGLLGNGEAESEGEGEGEGAGEEEDEEACKHVPGDWFVDVKASCKQAGLQKQYCKLCWALLKEEVVPQLDYHDYDNGACKVCSKAQTESAGIAYGKDENGDTVVTGIGSCTEKSLYISATAPDGTPVVGIKKDAFKGVNTILTLIVEDGVKYIGDGAFSGAESLDKVKLPLSIERVGTDAFKNCPIRVAVIPVTHAPVVKNDQLVNVTLYGVGSVPDRSYLGCSRLSNLTLEEGITSIGNNAFSSTSVTNVKIPDSVKKIGKSAFEFCKDLKVLTIGKGVETIEDYAFQNSSFLDNVYISAGVKYIGYRAFYRCPRITEATFEDAIGWVVTTTATSTTGQAVAESLLSDVAQAAEFLKTRDTGYVKNLS